MQIDPSLLKRELQPSWLQLKSRPLSLPNRRWLKHLANEAAMPGAARTVRAVIEDQVCASILSLVRLPGTPNGIGFPALLIPSTKGTATEKEAICTKPAMLIIDDRRAIQQVSPAVFHWDANSRRLHLAVSADTLKNGDHLLSISKIDLQAFKRGDALARQRLSAWEAHVHRLRIRADSGRHPKSIERSHRFFKDVTDQIVVPLLNHLQAIERKALGDFLLAISERPIPRIGRPSKTVQQRNRRQAVECYPFLALMPTVGHGPNNSVSRRRP